MTTTRYFASTDPGAPTLTGQSGSLIALLHACLVGTSGVAYGSGGSQKLAAGWSEPFTNTANKGVWRNSIAAGGTGYCMRVLDDASLGSGALEAAMRGYSSMSDLDTGTGPTPTSAQLTSGVIVRKSATADATAREWFLAADELGFWLYAQAHATQKGQWGIYGAGDLESEVPGDAHHFIVLGRTAINSASASQAGLTTVGSFSVSGSGSLYIGRGYAQTGTALQPAMMAMGAPAALGGIGLQADPSPGSGKRYVAPLWLTGENMIRGRLRGMFACLNNIAGTITTPTNITSAVGRPAGSILRACPVNYSGGANAVPLIECGVEW